MRDLRVLPAVGLAIGLCCALSSSTAEAAPAGPGITPIEVLELATDDADDQAKAMTLALRGRVRASKDYSLAEGDHSLAVFLAALKCGDVPDVSCQTRIADKLQAERYIWGTMRKTGKGEVALDLHLWQRGQAEVRQQITYSDNLTVAEDASLQRTAEQMFSKLVNFGKIGTAKLSSGQSIAGDLFIDGQGQGKFSNGQAEVTVPVGDHTFEVRSGGRVVAQAQGRVGASTPVEIDLVAVKADTGATTRQAPAWQKPAGYAAVGVGGALIVAAIPLTIWGASDGFSNDKFSQFKALVPKGQDVCDAAKNPKSAAQNAYAFRGDVSDTCSRSDTFKTMQYAFYISGGVLVAGGAYLLYSAAKGGSSSDGAATAKSRVEVTPVVGRQSGYVDVRVTF